jgi:hypothetical protein
MIGPAHVIQRSSPQLYERSLDTVVLRQSRGVQCYICGALVPSEASGRIPSDAFGAS